MCSSYFLFYFFSELIFFSRVLFFSNSSIDILTLKNIVWKEDNNINIYIKNSIIRTTQISRIKQSSGQVYHCRKPWPMGTILSQMERATSTPDHGLRQCCVWLYQGQLCGVEPFPGEVEVGADRVPQHSHTTWLTSAT